MPRDLRGNVLEVGDFVVTTCSGQRRQLVFTEVLRTTDKGVHVRSNEVNCESMFRLGQQVCRVRGKRKKT